MRKLKMKPGTKLYKVYKNELHFYYKNGSKYNTQEQMVKYLTIMNKDIKSYIENFDKNNINTGAEIERMISGYLMLFQSMLKEN